MRTVTVQAPVNIAVIKYWGKKDEDLIIPLNDSVSGTLSMDHLCATTSVAVCPTFTSNRMWLNGEEVDITANKRLVRCLRLVHELAGSSWPNDQFVHICSRNNFPTAAGLASSAAGYACLVYSLCKLFSVHDTEKISTLARLGSGSACRSVYGGFVQWIAGNSMDTSVARQIIDENGWPAIRILVLVVSDHKKDTSSTSGMQLSATTSELMQHRVAKVVPERTEAMLTAIQRRDFHRFAELTMKDSNQFHAICQDTYPPIRYMNDVSWSVVGLIHRLNAHHRTNVAAYTFDAGPNACLYCQADVVPELLALVRLMYSPTNGTPLEVKGIEYGAADQSRIDPSLLKYATDSARGGALKYVISTKIGSGPQIVTTELNEASLLGPTGLPK